MVTAYFLAEKQGNRKDLAIGLTVKNSYTLPCKKNLRMGRPYGVLKFMGRIGLSVLLGFLIGFRAPDYRPSRRNPYQCSDFNGGLPVPDVSASCPARMRCTGLPVTLCPALDSCAAG